jgi:tetratricopeptide (TPR) repeat protein
LKIKSYGFDTYTQPLDLKSKVPVGLLIMREADALYNAGNFSEALKEYEKLYSINPKDEHVERRINQCNEKINGNKITAEGKKQDLTFVFKGVKNNSLVILYLDNHLIGETNFAKGFQLKYMDVKPGAHELHVVCANLEWNDIIHTIEKTVFTFEYKNKKTGFGYKSSLELVK